MLNILARILAVMATFVVVVLLIGTLLPRGFETSSSIVIEAKPPDVFAQVNQIRMWPNWTMWNEHEVYGLSVEYSGAAQGVGAIQQWSEPRGEGKLWITESLENKEVRFTSAFANFPEMQSRITLTEVDQGTRVEWSSEGALPAGPFYGWFGLTFADSLALEYKKALEKLKTTVENQLADP